jgi:hypothetical protein
MVSETHLKDLEGILGELHQSGVPGAIVECGVWKGGCCMWMMEVQKSYGMDREFFLYDTFDGMTFPASEKDAAEARVVFNNVGNGYKRDYDKWHSEKKWAYAPIDLVKANISTVGYDPSKINYVQGDVLETLTKTVPSCIALLRLDTDWYESTKKELEVLFPLVSSNGYIVVDDYYAWKGSREATDEFLKLNKHTIINIPNNGSVLIMKKK